MKTAILAASSGFLAAVSSATLVAKAAEDYQAFFGIAFGAVTLVIFAWATIKNQSRQDEKFKEWKKHNGNSKDP